MKKIRFFLTAILILISGEYVLGAVSALSLPHTWDSSDGKSAYTEALGCTLSGIGTDYSSAPKLKFDTQGDYMIIQLADAPDEISFNIKGNSVSGTYSFKVQESADGTTYTDALDITSVTSSAVAKTATLQYSTRYIKLIYATKANGNMAVGGISITKKPLFVYLNLSGFTDWESSSACFNVWDGTANRQFTEVSSDCRGHIYAAEVAASALNTTIYVKRNSSDCNTKWNEVSGTLTSTNNMMTVTGWTAGTMGAYVPHYAITFDKQGHGADISSQCVSTISEPTTPMALGYTFGGWYETAACTGTAWDFSTAVSADKTLYAKWTETGTRTIYLKTTWSSNNWQTSNPTIFAHVWLDDANDDRVGDYIMTQLNACQPEYMQVTIPDNAAKVIFLRNANGTLSPIWSGEGYWNKTDKIVLAADKNLYEITDWNAGQCSSQTFTENKYTITFDANSGTGSMTAISNIACGTNQTLTTNTFTRSGYDFTGWNTAADGSGTAYADGAEIQNISASITLYAQWTERVKYTVTFNDRGTTHDTQQDYAGTLLTEPATPTGVCTTPTNYIFDGWSETPITAANVTSYTKVNFSTYTIPNHNVTLYAVYKWVNVSGGSPTKTVTLNFDDGSTVLTAPSDGSLSDEDVTVDGVTFNFAYAHGSNGKTFFYTTTDRTTNPYTELRIYAGTNVGSATITSDDFSSFTSVTVFATSKNATTAGTGNILVGSTSKYTHTITTATTTSTGAISLGADANNIVIKCTNGQYRVQKIIITGNVNGTNNYTTSPVCGAYISVTQNREVYVTGGNAGGTRATVQVQDTICYTSGSLVANSDGSQPRIYSNANDIVNISNNTQNSNFTVTYLADSTRTKVDDKFAITGKIVVKYTPTTNGVNENVRVYMHATYNTGTNAPIDSFDIHARALPSQFVIASKIGDKWYALNNNMSGSKAQLANGQLVVDNATAPTTATYAPDMAVYTFDAMPNTGDLRDVRFVGNSGKYLWAAAAGSTGIQNNTNSVPAGTGETQYDWLLKSSDNVTYTIKNIGNTRQLGLHNTNVAFGMYNIGSTYDVRILPITVQCNYNAKPEQVSLSTRKSTTATISLKTDATATKYQITADDGVNWTDATTTTSGDMTLISITGLSATTAYTYSIRGVHGTGTICSDTAKISFTTTNCDDAPTISYAADGLTLVSNCGELLLEATGVTASSVCSITEYGFQLATNTAFTQDVQNIACELDGTTLDAEGTVMKGGDYYVRIYAINEVDTGFSSIYLHESISGLPNLRIFTRDDATTAAMINGKAELRVGAATNSLGALTWTVTNPDGTSNASMASTLASKGMFIATSMGVYTISVSQAATVSPDYCAQTATAYIEVRKPHYYGHVTNCAALNNNDIEVLSISEQDITLEFDDADMVQIEIVKENKGGGGETTEANELFFSKYFEATNNVKLLAVFNGTASDIDLSNYSIKMNASGKNECSGTADWSTTITLSGTLAPMTEKLLFCRGNNEVDASVVSCVDTDHPGLIPASENNTNISFSGNDAVMLLKNGTPIDLIGAGNSSKANLGDDCTVGVVEEDTADFMDAKGWYNADGRSIDRNGNIGTTSYALSTNRCLLVRMNTVVDGQNAITRNTTDFVTLGGTYGEWAGVQIPDGDDKGVQNSCDAFDQVASFNYAEYFNRYEAVTPKVDTTSLDFTHNADGSWTLDIASFEGTEWEGKNFHDLSCTTVLIKGYTKDSNNHDSICTSLNYKVPIIVDTTTTTTDAKLFGFDGEGRVICPDCDVVIRDNKKLEVVIGGYNDVRDVTVYSGASLYVPTDRPYTARKLTIESENNAVGYTLISNGKLVAEDGIVHTKRIDAIAWYDFSLPYDCKVADIVRTNGKSVGTYGTDWVIMYYDGQKRANTGTPNGATPTNWVSLSASATLEAGVGYIVGLGGSHNTHPAYKVRFVLPNKAAQPYIENAEGDSRNKAVKGYTGAAAKRLPCHQGWNYIGSPYVSQFKGTEQDPTWKSTKLLLNGYYTDGLLGTTYDTTTVTYNDLYLAIDEGTNGATDWVQYKASAADLPPFRAFFVQAVSDGNVNFVKAARSLPQLASAPMRRDAETEVESEFRLVVSNETYGSDRTTIMLHSSYTDDYDLGYDMARMLNNVARPQPFTLSATDYLIYNAANRETAESSDIPLGVKISATGEYTFALDVLKAMDDYSAIYLIDKDENNLQFDLLQGNYTTRIASGLNTDRFAIRLIAKPKVTTDIDGAEGAQTANVYRDGETIKIENLPQNATVRVIDAVGRVLHTQKTTNQQLQFVSPIRGAYIIQVISEKTNYSIKIVL